MNLSGDNVYDGKFSIRKGQGLTQGIAGELGLNHEDCKKLGSVWFEIIDLAKEENAFNEGTKKYVAGETLFVGDTFEFSANTWNKIVDKVNQKLNRAYQHINNDGQPAAPAAEAKENVPDFTDVGWYSKGTKVNIGGTDYYSFDENSDTVYDAHKQKHSKIGIETGVAIADKVIGINFDHSKLNKILVDDNFVNKNTVVDLIKSFENRRNSKTDSKQGIVEYLDNEFGSSQPTVKEMNRISNALLELAKDKGLEVTPEYSNLFNLINDKNMHNSGDRIEDFKAGQAKKIDAAIKALIAKLPKDE